MTELVEKEVSQDVELGEEQRHPGTVQEVWWGQGPDRCREEGGQGGQ